MFRKIISGGQTGVDRSALDFAIANGITAGGWCPKGRRADDGPIDLHYPLQETPMSGYRQRTNWNMRDGDGTLIMHRGQLTGGTLLTVQLARTFNKSHWLVNLNRSVNMEEVREWLQNNHIRVLNVAGPRERGNRGIYLQSFIFLQTLCSENRLWVPTQRIPCVEA